MVLIEELSKEEPPLSLHVELLLEFERQNTIIIEKCCLIADGRKVMV